jgi:hypothetical protein
MMNALGNVIIDFNLHQNDHSTYNEENIFFLNYLYRTPQVRDDEY